MFYPFKKIDFIKVNFKLRRRLNFYLLFLLKIVFVIIRSVVVCLAISCCVHSKSSIILVRYLFLFLRCILCSNSFLCFSSKNSTSRFSLDQCCKKSKPIISYTMCTLRRPFIFSMQKNRKLRRAAQQAQASEPIIWIVSWL